VLKQVGLQDRANTYYKKLSGGQKQRVAIAAALSSNPALLFLDEISTGLDPQSRRAMWDMILELKKRGKTIFMTTHYMEEAERLADRVGIIDNGRMIALDTPERLIKEHGGGSRIEYEGAIIEMGERHEQVEGRTIIYASDPKTLVPKLMDEASKLGVDLKNLRVEEPSLEDVFLRLTGREMRD
jgi:ABC-2 type transport system ATP-binding protein